MDDDATILIAIQAFLMVLSVLINTILVWRTRKIVARLEGNRRNQIRIDAESARMGKDLLRINYAIRTTTEGEETNDTD